jgi:hypothetical protein
MVCPHDMDIGGSQLNAIELAAAIRDLGHDVLIYSADGPLMNRVRDLDLPHRRRHPAPRRPSLVRAADLARVAREWRADVVHGYEWPPILEAAAAAAVSRPVAVGTVMSMSVAPFLPQGLPLVVGTQQIARSCERRGVVAVIEPPVDTVHDRPGAGGEHFSTLHPCPGDTVRIVVVSRLVPELKLEGIRTAIAAMPHLAARLGEGPPVRLTLVGDGPARADVEEAVAALGQTDTGLVEVLGSLEDPRGAYDSADVVLGMGGSALRAMAFAKPVVVQGEGGFFEPLTEESLPVFLDQGFYGRAALDSEQAVAGLVEHLVPLVRSATLRRQRGAWGREVVEELFGMQRAARRLEQFYLAAATSVAGRRADTSDCVAALPGLVAHKANRLRDRWKGVEKDDDFNAQPAGMGQ